MTVALLALLALGPQQYTNPVYDRDLPDPAVLRDGGMFWMTHTTGGPSVGWPLYSSPDARKWTFVTHLLDGSNKPAWMRDAFWAPEIFRTTTGRYLLTFTAASNTNGRLCVGMATADQLSGPYTVSPQPLVADSVSVLDSHILQEPDGRMILYWKRDGNKQGVNGDIRAQLLAPSGTAFASGSSPTVLLQGNENATAPEAAWEKGLVEAPWVMRRGGTYYLFYSGAFIDTSYAVGVASGPTAFGPFKRYSKNPILKSNEIWGGPGHGAFFTDDAGNDFHYYHARRQSNPGAGRVQLMDRMTWRRGWPMFGNEGTPSFSPQVVPVLGPPRI